jgi:uncharacterized protein
LSILEKKFTVPFGAHHLQGDVLSASGADLARLVILHGAGLGTRERFRPLRACLAEQAISSLAFDFVGHGETGGGLGESSLQSRTEQACAVIEAVGATRPFSVLGSSMGAYNAVKLLELYPIENLILFVPAIYHTAAYSVPFGDAFRRVIREPNSWAGSDAWSILEKFRGRLLLVVAGQDAVIPEDVVQRIYASALNASAHVRYVVPHSPHLLIHYLSHERQEFDHVTGLVQELFEDRGG